MTDPALQIDPAFAKALDRYEVPPPSTTFADRIVAAAGATPSLPASRPSRRDRRGPWTRRAVAGGLALVLGTTAVAATLLERAGIRLPEVVAMLSPAPRVAPPVTVVKHHAPVTKPHAALPAVPPDIAIDDVPPTPALEPPHLPMRAAPLGERLASLPPGERRVVIRRAVRRAIAVRAIERRLAADGAVALPPPGAAMTEPPRLLERPAIRAAIAERIAEVRTARIAKREGLELPPPASVEAPGPETSASIASPDANGPAAEAPAPQARYERLRRFGELRRLRALRQELRRQRRR